MTTSRLRAAIGRLVPVLGGSDAGGHMVGEGDPSAIAHNGVPGRGALLAIHGFAGTPNEVRPLTDVAARLGLFARAPRLPGHGPDPRTLMDVGLSDWTRATGDALLKLSEIAGSKVVVGGLSLGSLLATYLAATYPERVGGLVVLANATRLHWMSPALPLLFCETFEPRGNRFFTRKDGADIRDPEARRMHLTYNVNPMRSAVEVLRAARIVRALLPNVRCPTLVIHGRLDRVCPVGNATRFAKSLGTSDVEVAIMPRSAHIVTVDVDRLEVASRVGAFLRRVTDQGQ
jgi:carboxylesterase